jgi:uncharacterized protein (TIGR02246 family)
MERSALFAMWTIGTLKPSAGDRVMRPHLFALAVPALLVLCLSSSSRAGDEEAVAAAQQNLASYLQAFNANDVSAILATLSEDAGAVFMAGDTPQSLLFVRVNGQKEIQSYFEVFFKQYPKVRLAGAVVNAHFVTPDVLVSEVSYTATGLPSSAGPIQFESFRVSKRVGGAWKLVRVCDINLVPAFNAEKTDKK